MGEMLSVRGKGLLLGALVALTRAGLRAGALGSGPLPSASPACQNHMRGLRPLEAQDEMV